MKKTIRLGEKNVPYSLKTYKGQRHINMHIRDDGLLVTAPRRVSLSGIVTALQKNEKWILKNMSEHYHAGTLSVSPKVVRHLKNHLRPIVTQKLEHFNSYYQFAYNAVALRNQKSRWGSCSANGNLSFNVHIAGLPEHLQDYIIVHEICHLGELNHSDAFWKLVERCVPNHKECRRELRIRRIGNKA